MPRPDATLALDAAAAVARSNSGLELLVLFGSRASGDDGSGADWDFGYLARDDADVPGLLAALVEALGDDRVDLADLGRANGLLRYRAARNGQLLLEATPEPPGSRIRVAGPETGARGGNSWTGGPPALPAAPEGLSRDRRELTAPAPRGVVTGPRCRRQ